MFWNKPKWVQRTTIIVLTAVLALAARTIAVTLFDVDFISYDGEIGHEAIDVGVRPIIVVPLIAGLLGWAALEVLERVAKTRARLIWVIGAVVVYVVTLSPLFPWDMPGKTKVALMIFHTLVAAAYIPLMAKTTREKVIE
jgi:hypothetical protein